MKTINLHCYRMTFARVLNTQLTRPRENIIGRSPFFYILLIFMGVIKNYRLYIFSIPNLCLVSLARTTKIHSKYMREVRYFLLSMSAPKTTERTTSFGRVRGNPDDVPRENSMTSDVGPRPARFFLARILCDIPASSTVMIIKIIMTTTIIMIHRRYSLTGQRQ